MVNFKELIFKHINSLKYLPQNYYMFTIMTVPVVYTSMQNIALSRTLNHCAIVHLLESCSGIVRV